jgi:hypothetical protein
MAFEAARSLCHVVAGGRVGGCHVTCHLRVIFLGSVFGCLWICDEVPDRGVLRQEMAAQVVGGSISDVIIRSTVDTHSCSISIMSRSQRMRYCTLKRDETVCTLFRRLRQNRPWKHQFLVFMDRSCNGDARMPSEHDNKLSCLIAVARSRFGAMALEVVVAHFTMQGVSPHRDVDYMPWPK